MAATAIGLDLGLVSAANGAAFIAAGLLSVLIFPLVALTLMGDAEELRETSAGADRPSAPQQGRIVKAG